MKKGKCAICNKTKGKRRCNVRNNEMICPLCCGESRDFECEGCVFYDGIQRSKKHKLPPKSDFVVELNSEIETLAKAALSYGESGNTTKGDEILSEIDKKYPDNYIIIHTMGMLEIIKDNKDKAIEYFDKVIKLYPYYVDAYFNKAQLYKEKGDFLSMIEAYRSVIEVGNTADKLVMEADSIIRRIKRGVKKTEGVDLETYLENEKTFKQAFSDMKDKKWEKALAGFKECVSKVPKHVQSYGNIGLCYGFLGEKKKALAAFDKALELDPTYQPAIINRLTVEQGRDLEQKEFKEIEYYKDYHEGQAQMRSVMQELIGE